MAITWTVDVDITNLDEDRVRVTGARLDDVADETRTYSFRSQYDRTLNKNQNLLAWNNQIWAMYQAELAEETAESTFISDWEALMQTDLESREP